MILVILLIAILFISITSNFFHKKDNILIAINQVLLMALIIAVLGYAFYQHQDYRYTLDFLNFNNIEMTLAIQFDALAKIMMIFILVIGSLIYRYAQNYLESDSTRVRFLSQFNLVIFSVLLLVISANLLTAFVAWQFIGINLYVLLNHYHHDPAANRAAKKKFVINRIGDCSFLLAIIIAYHSQSAGSFAALQSSPHAGLICSLLFISVMTKCAQFPFHVWLIDTMETPTPVSALMHAGVINAGGILLTRISSTLAHFHAIDYVILLVGLTSACLSIQWMNQQSDTKKKLAYSTMGQMGYMLTQCSLGSFPAAIFHLISHGFYKASLFLNAGETLNLGRQNNTVALGGKIIFKSLVITILIFSLGVFLLKEQGMHIPVLMYGFAFMTIITLVIEISSLSKNNKTISVINYIFIGLIFMVYLYCLNHFSLLIPQYEYASTIPVSMQVVVIGLLIFLQYFIWIRKRQLKTIKIKDKTEVLLRHFILNPLRAVGDLVNTIRYKKFISILYLIGLFIAIAGFGYGLLQVMHIIQINSNIFKPAIFIFLMLGIFALVIANRCLSIKPLITYLILFELVFTNIALFDSNSEIVKIGIFHIINVSAVLLVLIILSKQNSTNMPSKAQYNRFPTRVFYLVVSLLLLIGIPGTASFISEFYLLSVLINNGLLFVFMYISLIILIAIVVMHSLQLYAFNKVYSKLLSQSIDKKGHVIFLAVIALNIICGVFPDLFLQYL
jgi:NADH:ubiquinone oxidoreductase subunit 5 (subunit L)/multisubunit Na+/H+ antiporter MnhA subunit